MRHEFPSGAWIDVMPIQDLKMKHRDQLAELAQDGTPMKDDEVDWAEIDAQRGGRQRWSVRWTRHRRNVAIAMVLTGWSYDLPLPQISADGDLVNEDSIGEADPELAAFIEPYIAKLTREPDPKGTTTSSSNGRSKAKAAASPTA